MSKKLTPTQKERRALMRHIRSQVKVLNKRRAVLLRENARNGIVNDSTDDNLMETWRARTKTASKNKLSTGRLSHMSLTHLQQLSGFIDEYAGVKDVMGKKRGSHYKHYNKRERMAMERKALGTFNYHHYVMQKQAIDNDAAARGVKPDYGNLKPTTRAQYRRMIALFSSEDLAILRAENLLSSEQIVEMSKQMNDRTLTNIPQAVDALYDLMGGKTNAVATMKHYQQQDPTEFRNLLLALAQTSPDKREELLKKNTIYLTIKGE